MRSARYIRFAVILCGFVAGCASLHPTHKTIYVPVTGDKQWRDAVHDRSYMVSLTTKAEEDAYVHKDKDLNARIKAIVKTHLQANADSKCYVLDDWWPSQCRYIDIATSALSDELVEKLRALLTGEYQHWRIQVIVYGDIRIGSTEVGGIMIQSDKVLVEHEVLDAVDLIGQAN